MTPLVWTTDPSAALVAARDVDAQPALDLLDDLAASASLAGGIYFDPGTSRAVFSLGAGRNSRVPSVVLSGHNVDADAVRGIAAGDVVNDVTVTYVNPADPDAEPSARAVNSASVAESGRRTRTISTDLVNGADATTRAQAEVTRFGVVLPRWANVKTGTRYGEVARLAAERLLGAGPGLRARLADLPAPSALLWDGYLEGWQLTVDADEWEVEVDLSPAAWSGPLLAWSGVPASTQRQDVIKPWRWADALDELPTRGL